MKTKARDKEKEPSPDYIDGIGWVLKRRTYDPSHGLDFIGL